MELVPLLSKFMSAAVASCLPGGSQENLLPLMVAVPLAGAFVVMLLPRRLAAFSDLIGNGVMLYLFAAVWRLVGTAAYPVVYQLGGYRPPIGINMLLDGLSMLLLLTIVTIGLMATLYSVAYMERYTSKHRYYALFLLMVTGMIGITLSGDLFNMYVFLEIASIASYALVAFGCERDETEASFKYLVLGNVASAFILMGVAFTYGNLGTLNLAHISRLVTEGGLSNGLLLSLGMFIMGFGLKAALVPFHAWLPDAHPSAPAPISAMLSGVFIKAVGVYSLVRLVFNVFGFTPQIGLLLQFLGAVSMIGGVLMAIGQWDMKRLFAYHSISQIGYVVLAIGLGTPLGIMAGLFHLVNHAIFKSLLFLTAGSVENATGTRQLKKMGGLRQRMPVTSATSMIASLSIAGVPPFNGFWSKLLIIGACLMARSYWLALAAALVSIVTLASFLKVQKFAFFGKLHSAHEQVKEASLSMCVAMVILALLCLGIGLYYILPVLGVYPPTVLNQARDAVFNSNVTYGLTVDLQLGAGE